MPATDTIVAQLQAPPLVIMAPSFEETDIDRLSFFYFYTGITAIQQ